MANVKYVSATRVYAKDAPPAVDALDLDIKDGEFMVLVGPSGSGKTTALRMLAGLEPLDGGRVEIGEKDVTFVPPKDRDIAMVFQNYALYPSKTVAENMGFALKMQGVPKEERARRVREGARPLHLDDTMLERKPKELSQGQPQPGATRRVIMLPTAVRMTSSLAGLRVIGLGIRPEHLHRANGSGPVAGEVMLVEELGADALLHVRLAEDHNLVVARTEGRKPPAPGQQVTFNVQPDDVFVFQPETGARLAG